MRSALRLIPLMAIGAVAAFLLAGPLTSFYKTHAVAGRPQPSASSSIDPHASPTSCPASLPVPKSTTVVTPSVPALPFSIWVNDPLGVNLRPTASASSGRVIATLSQGTQATADARAPDSSGNTWYHVKVGSQAGWLRADFVSSTSLHTASGFGWSLMLPQGYQAAGSDPSLTTVTKAGDEVPFLILQTSTASTLTLQVPATVRADLAPVADHTVTIQVWSYTVTEQVSRVALDTCKVTSAWARPDQGWPYTSSVYIHTTARNYLFTFLTPDASSPLVRQVLDSVALS